MFEIYNEKLDSEINSKKSPIQTRYKFINKAKQ